MARGDVQQRASPNVSAMFYGRSTFENRFDLPGALTLTHEEIHVHSLTVRDFGNLATESGVMPSAILAEPSLRSAASRSER
jgi:hypothetical protein